MSNESVNTTPARRGFISTLLLALVIIILAAGASVGGCWYFFFRHATTAPQQHVVVEQPSVVQVKPPVYTELKPFTVNLNDTEGRMLYVGLSLQVSDDEAVKALTQHLPEVRNRILMLLSSQKADNLSTPQDKERLANEIREALMAPFDTSAIAINVRQVLFTDFIVQ
ncbi:flagellar basal body-associated protein FliL [Zymobacter palmae]|uniref:Flagellar protein FliL n=1 Tax=Zymobacter palmae TaxID=33074 RepID=A0A348HFE8_9GAMM|nr:flagellar basal body-associated protein FliL [Zymobacter palmae]BBG30350.1 flagellar basalbody-associated protein [Zymobacter palmae]